MDIDAIIEKLEQRKSEAVNKGSKLNIQHKIDLLLKKKSKQYDND